MSYKYDSKTVKIVLFFKHGAIMLAFPPVMSTHLHTMLLR